jgi:hypothetical protein
LPPPFPTAPFAAALVLPPPDTATLFAAALFPAAPFSVPLFLVVLFAVTLFSAPAAFPPAAFPAAVFLAAGFLDTAFFPVVLRAGALSVSSPAAVPLAPAPLLPAAGGPESAGFPADRFAGAARAVVLFPAAGFLPRPVSREVEAFVPRPTPRTDFTAPAARPVAPPRALFFPLTSLAAPPVACVDLPDADCCTAVFFATMAAAPSHIVILLANRAGTINRLESRGNGAHRPIRPARACRAASLHPLCPAPRGVIRPSTRPRTRTRAPLHSGPPGGPKTGRPLSARRRTLGGAKSVDGDE